MEDKITSREVWLSAKAYSLTRDIQYCRDQLAGACHPDDVGYWHRAKERDIADLADIQAELQSIRSKASEHKHISS